MRVKLTGGRVGNGGQYDDPGAVVDVPADVADRMIARGQATVCDGPQPKAGMESAAIGPPENAAHHHPRKR